MKYVCSVVAFVLCAQIVCAEDTMTPLPLVVTETITIGQKSYSFVFTRTGDIVPMVPDVADPSAEVRYEESIFGTVRILGAADGPEAWSVWFARCMPDDVFDPVEFADWELALDPQTGEYVVLNTCLPLEDPEGTGVFSTM